MLAEMNITLLGRGTHLSGDLGRILKIVDESGIRYRLTPSGTCLEGEWDEVMDLVKKCHREARSLRRRKGKWQKETEFGFYLIWLAKPE